MTATEPRNELRPLFFPPFNTAPSPVVQHRPSGHRFGNIVAAWCRACLGNKGNELTVKLLLIALSHICYPHYQQSIANSSDKYFATITTLQYSVDVTTVSTDTGKLLETETIEVAIDFLQQRIRVSRTDATNGVESTPEATCEEHVRSPAEYSSAIYNPQTMSADRMTLKSSPKISNRDFEQLLEELDPAVSHGYVPARLRRDLSDLPIKLATADTALERSFRITTAENSGCPTRIEYLPKKGAEVLLFSYDVIELAVVDQLEYPTRCDVKIEFVLPGQKSVSKDFGPVKPKSVPRDRVRRFSRTFVSVHQNHN